MDAKAHLRHVRISPQKARLVINQIRGLSVERAVNLLRYSPKKAAGLIKKTLESAIANAENNFGADIDELVVSAAYVNQGPTFKRIRARAKGRADRELRPTSHITVVVSETESE